MPIDGNPADIPGTGIPVELLLNTLKNAPTETVLVLADMNRSQSMKAGETIGAQTAELARDLEIPTLLSCRPNQVSRETSALRQGFFTTALLEGLRSGQCSTIKGLDRFLSERLPQLCDHHLRPKQEPLMVVQPPGKAHLVILPDNSEAMAAVAGRNGNMTAAAEVDGFDRPSRAGVTAQVELPPAMRAVEEPRVPVSTASELNSTAPTAGGNDRPIAPKPEDADNGASDKSFLQQLILWSGATALVLLLGVFLTNRSIFSLGMGETRDRLLKILRIARKNLLGIPSWAVGKHQNKRYRAVVEHPRTSPHRCLWVRSRSRELRRSRRRVRKFGLRRKLLSETVRLRVLIGRWLRLDRSRLPIRCTLRPSRISNAGV
ncbi:MAG: hypothetical protein HC894_26870 [Microcoleus sp. SM1_3_4]|nr:hypothetical protein [Microcoleus sp. SM1_3_4]